ncbi:Predicted dehydrogenase [Amycolatopsis marina]|uniref:Predicted dehydrogenase n=1 Tax=Amycolatopsis marina TaxID=490629 RepID=A0A1I0ZNU4_9PSEU|nr:Gfo/Idh/MocA family oxidoreductase [Amycolatopsis marina]SFB26048.1 Predicted dehydrogenase [Amycolatopsis marina]
MKLLLIGFSRFARRRVLPAVAVMDEIETIDIASSHAGTDAVGHIPKLGRVHADWREAIHDMDPGLVYVSLINSEHAQAVRCAIERGHHVVVDKPGFLNLDTTEEMVALARSRSRVLAEATCYSFHPMYPEVRSVAREFDTDITKVVAIFTPPVPADDFRCDRSAGGGALLDTGPYMASLGRVLWGTEPDRVTVIVGDRTTNGLETSYSVLAGYPGGRTVIGQFGFTAAYRNSLQLLGPGIAVDLARPFSAPPDMTVDIRIESSGESHTRSVHAADSMQIFLSSVLDAVRAGSREFDAPLLSDARTRDRLVRAASDG